MLRTKAISALKKLRRSAPPSGGQGQKEDRSPPENAKDSLTRDVLTEAGLLRSNGWKLVTSVEFLAALLSTGTLLYIALIFTPVYIRESAQKALTALAVGGSFFLGYRQWYLGRHEVSYDKYYDRLPLANDYIDQVGREERKDETGSALDHLWNMRAFSQLDNLEYILGKYEHGFVDIYLVERAVHVFKAECKQPKFREKVLYWIGAQADQQVAEGYRQVTCVAARYIVARHAG